MAVFVGGKGLSLFLSAFSLTLPLYVSKLPLLFLCSRPLSSSPSLSVTPATSLFLSQCACCQLKLNFLPGPCLFLPLISPSFFSFSFYSFCYLFITTSHVLFLYSLTLLLHDPSFSLPTIMSISLLPPSQLLPLSH